MYPPLLEFIKKLDTVSFKTIIPIGGSNGTKKIVIVRKVSSNVQACNPFINRIGLGKLDKIKMVSAEYVKVKIKVEESILGN